jgi:hypothetical protein
MVLAASVKKIARVASCAVGYSVHDIRRQFAPKWTGTLSQLETRILQGSFRNTHIQNVDLTQREEAASRKWAQLRVGMVTYPAFGYMRVPSVPPDHQPYDESVIDERWRDGNCIVRKSI